MTTKICSKCGSKALLHFTSLNIKICDDCKHEMPWNLDPGQKPMFEKTKPAK